MGFDILGQERPLAALQAALGSGRVHHAYLFSGPDGVGKERLALQLAQALNCTEPAAQRPCRACETCLKIEHGTHPDVSWLLTEAERVARKQLSRAELDKAPSRDIRIADIREMERRVRLPPYAGRHKVVVAIGADRMNPQAQNALLKTLEEPPPKTTLVLVTASAGMLLPTVRSRCARIPFGPLPLDLVAARVAEAHDCDLATARVLATLAGGSLGGALALDPDSVAERRGLLERLHAIDPSDGAALLAFADAFSEDRAEALSNLGLVALWYRDVLAMQSGADESLVTNVDLLPEAHAEAGRLSARELLHRLELVEEARLALESNVTPRLAVEAMAAGFRG